MTLSKRGDYVLRSALSLARAFDSGRHRKIREVVAEMGVPRTFASQILADLVKAGLAESRAGKDGGYRLSHPPEEIRLLDVVEAGEGPLRSERCALGDGPCRWDAVCPLHEIWLGATSALRDVLAATTLAEVLQADLELERGVRESPADSHRHPRLTLDVEDWIHVERPVEVLPGALGDERFLTAALIEALASADGLRRTLVPGARSWAPRRSGTTVEVLPLEGEDSAAWSLAAEVLTDDGGVVRCELRLSLDPVDAERSVLRCTGRIRPPGEREVDETEQPSLGRVGSALVRSMLRSLALLLEQQGGGGTLASRAKAGPRPGPLSRGTPPEPPRDRSGQASSSAARRLSPGARPGGADGGAPSVTTMGVGRA
jgi:Rrf2 family protein